MANAPITAFRHKVMAALQVRVMAAQGHAEM